MALTPKQEAFVREYLIDLNATQAAIRAGYDWPLTNDGYYVYFLIDDDQIFYIGKGKGKRVSSHRRDCNSDRGNQVKSSRLRLALEADRYAEHIFCAGMTEPDALRLERALIKKLRKHGLTNISSGHVHPLESLIATIDANLAKFRPFDEWDRIAPQHARDFALKQFGSMRAFYDWIISSFIRLRGKCELKLKLIKGNQNDTARG